MYAFLEFRIANMCEVVVVNILNYNCTHFDIIGESQCWKLDLQTILKVVVRNHVCKQFRYMRELIAGRFYLAVRRPMLYIIYIYIYIYIYIKYRYIYTYKYIYIYVILYIYIYISYKYSYIYVYSKILHIYIYIIKYYIYTYIYKLTWLNLDLSNICSQFVLLGRRWDDYGDYYDYPPGGNYNYYWIWVEPDICSQFILLGSRRDDYDGDHGDYPPGRNYNYN